MISVIIPAFNEAKYLPATIQSVRSQNPPHEIVVVCNGCTDGTEKLAKQLADKVIILKERGVSKARNVGAQQATYSNLVFLDADTKLTTGVLDGIMKHQGFGTARVTAESKKLKDKVFFALKNLEHYAYSSSGLIFCSKDIFQKAGGFEESLSKFEDGRFLNRARKFGKFHIVKAPVMTSTRRYEKKGYLGTALFWTKEYFLPSDQEYDAVRCGYHSLKSFLQMFL